MAGARAVVQVLASCVLAVVVVLALVASGLQSGSHLELLAKAGGAGAAKRGDGVSAQTIKRIMVKMEKKEHKPVSKTAKLQNEMAAEQVTLANLKVRLSPDTSTAKLGVTR